MYTCLALIFLQVQASLGLAVEEGGKLKAISTYRPKKREVLVEVFQQIVETLGLAGKVDHPGVSILQFLQSLHTILVGVSNYTHTALWVGPTNQ